MYHHIADFVADWQVMTGYTVTLFEKITDEAKGIKVHENVRTLERLAWHITETLPEMGTQAGLFDHNELEHIPVPATMAQLINTYQTYSQKLIDAVKSRWTDEQLNDDVNMYGQTWTKGMVLSVFIGHEAHHRSQMTVVMRLVGLPVPGLFGPAKEEWAQMGLPVME
ncbi:DinB family protein [Mucilaginibacter lacusdianchii]|uniref:DinB family protein n=1 Tax=Mucilaginibacter lacusdianchii TaxID=2684211 RepID=UPI00131BF3B1|nr:DinB family protein [Mucilaginibacter sp. JXJ CY 39]